MAKEDNQPPRSWRRARFVLATALSLIAGAASILGYLGIPPDLKLRQAVIIAALCIWLAAVVLWVSLAWLRLRQAKAKVPPERQPDDQEDPPQDTEGLVDIGGLVRRLDVSSARIWVDLMMTQKVIYQEDERTRAKCLEFCGQLSDVKSRVDEKTKELLPLVDLLQDPWKDLVDRYLAVAVALAPILQMLRRRRLGMNPGFRMDVAAAWLLRVMDNVEVLMRRLGRAARNNRLDCPNVYSVSRDYFPGAGLLTQ